MQQVTDSGRGGQWRKQSGKAQGGQAPNG